LSIHAKIEDVLEIILAQVADEAGRTQDELSIETESIITRGLLEAFKRGEEYAHHKPTIPASPHMRRPTPSGPIPTVKVPSGMWRRNDDD